MLAEEDIDLSFDSTTFSPIGESEHFIVSPKKRLSPSPNCDSVKHHKRGPSPTDESGSVRSSMRPRARSRGRRYTDNQKASSPLPPTETIVIANMPFSLTKAELESFLDSHLQSQGPEDIVLKEKSCGGFSGMAFVKYSTVDKAAEALDCLTDKQVGGRKLRVEYKANRSRTSSLSSVSSLSSSPIQPCRGLSESQPNLLNMPTSSYTGSYKRTIYINKEKNVSEGFRPRTFSEDTRRNNKDTHDKAYIPLRQPLGPSWDSGRGFQSRARACSFGSTSKRESVAVNS